MKTLYQNQPPFRKTSSDNSVSKKQWFKSVPLLWTLLLTISWAGVSQAGQITYYTESEMITLDNCIAGTLLISPEYNNHYGFDCKQQPSSPIYVADPDSVVWIGEIRLLCRMDMLWRESKTDFNLLLDCTEPQT